ncbi:Histone-lysine N-methyltransferase CLF [Gracilariopsis chorda]|uniref:Histone-lysine N-methyltransferase CLF n=1 Tax=Gracilariopsis chorda TaxID=448386 RepID=A0A2V3IJ89_9FLOR|nr:Histone-lysine N-methyltransferase CLF [Gracilariopsis chorda]|eukprot:PXF42154.1 Histone-lysine N-methyltransferase CLF [Gracilariopsis chorda]
MEEDRIENGKCFPLPPDELRTLVEKCFSEAKEKLALSRKRTILRNLKHAQDQTKAHHQQIVNRVGTNGQGRTTEDAALESVNAVRAVPSRPTSKKVLRDVSRCPNGLAWIRIRSNMRAADKGKDNFFVPYIGESDAHQNFSNKLAAETFEDDKRVPEDVSDDEESQHSDDDLEYAQNTVAVPEKRDSVNLLHKHTPPRQSSISEQVSSTPSLLCSAKRRKISEPVWKRASMRVALRQVVQKLNCPSVQPFAAVVCDVFGLTSAEEVLRCFQNVQYREEKYEEADREKHIRTAYRSEMLRILDGSLKPTPTESLNGDSIPFFICRQCYTYNCFLHGNQTAKPSRPIPDKTRKDSATRQLSTNIERNCDDRAQGKCWHINQHVHECTSWWRFHAKNAKKAEDVRVVIQELCHIFGADPCRVSSACKTLLTPYYADLNVTCCRIGYLFEVFGGIRHAESGLKTRRRMRKSFSVDCSKSKRQKMRMEDESGLRGGLRKDFEPCQHFGPCSSKSCPCVQNGVNCEKYCACNHTRAHRDRADRRLNCVNAFKGCTCRSAVACVSNACVCYSWKRECDPDLCRACHECKGDRNVKSCRNVGLLLGKRKRIVVGHSDTHGWGAFASSSIAKNEVIGEYVGEIVDQEHADRRGQLYDEVQYSFLFNITDDFALDSTRIGNKLRFCNHAFDPNCEARLMRVAGDIRVGLYAKRDIGKHEELFFDYKYKSGPDWAVPAKNEKSSRRYNTKQRNAPTAMKTASTNGVDKLSSSVALVNERQQSNDLPCEIKMEPKGKIKVSTRSQPREESPPVKLQRLQAGNTIHRTSNRKTDDGQAVLRSKPEHVVSKAEQAPRQRLSIWRGVLKRVAPRAADAISLDDLPRRRTQVGYIRGGVAEEVQARRGVTEKAGDIRDAATQEIQGRRDRGTLEKAQFANSSNDVKHDIRSSEGARVGNTMKSRELSRSIEPSRPDRISPGNLTPDKPNDWNKRLKEVFGSDNETDHEEHIEGPSAEPGSEAPCKDEPPIATNFRSKNPRLDSDERDESVSLPAKRRRPRIYSADAPQLETPLHKKKEKGSAIRNGAKKGTNPMTFTRDNPNGIRSRFVSHRNAREYETADGNGAPRRPKGSLSPLRTPRDRTGGVVSHLNRQPKGNMPASARSRSRPSTPRLTITKDRENVTRERPNRSSQRSADNRRRSYSEHTHGDPGQDEIPMVNLISDDGSQASSGSFNPGLFKWLR